MPEPSPEVQAELRTALAQNQGKLGIVYKLLEDGLRTNKELVEGGGGAGPGAVANSRATIRAILEGNIPAGAQVAAQAGRSVGGLLRANQWFSAATRQYLEDLRTDLDSKASDNAAIEEDALTLDRGAAAVEKAAQDVAGIYVYTFPMCLRSPEKTDPDRYLMKIGKTERFSGVRIREQVRATSMPQDPKTLRVYHAEGVDLGKIEKTFHRFLEAAGHSRAEGEYTGREWYHTNTEFLDTVAEVLELTIYLPPSEGD